MTAGVWICPKQRTAAFVNYLFPIFLSWKHILIPWFIADMQNFDFIRKKNYLTIKMSFPEDS